MARLQRICPLGIPQHIIQRGNNRQVCFAADEDFATYAHWLHESAQKYRVAIHAWVFMTNHVHLLATPRQPDGVSRMMQRVGRHYVRYFNHVYRRSGTLWEGRFKSCIVAAEAYVLICQRYIELNPVRASMVTSPSGYRWSSYRCNGLGKGSRLWTPHEVYLGLGTQDNERLLAYQSLFKAHIDPAMLEGIRAATNKNGTDLTVIASEAWQSRNAESSGWRLFATLTPAGPPCGRSALASSRVPRVTAFRNDGHLSA